MTTPILILKQSTLLVFVVFAIRSSVVCDLNIILKYPFHRDCRYSKVFNCGMKYVLGDDFAKYFQYQDQSLQYCGVCGDWPGDAVPRDNERGGLYYGQYPGPKAAYIQGEKGKVKFSCGAPYIGYVELRICADSKTEVTNLNCFDNLLRLEGENGPHWTVQDTRVLITSSYKQFDVTVSFKIPDDWTCEECVIQMHYRAERSATKPSYDCPTGDVDKNGICLQQETFRDCADFRILPKDTGIELLAPAYNTMLCMEGTSDALPSKYVALNTCNAANLDQNQRISGLPHWNGNGGKNPFVIVFPTISLCLQVNDPDSTHVYGSVTLEECTFARNQNFITKLNKDDTTFRIKSRANDNCLSYTGPNQIVTQEPCDDSNPVQFWIYKVNDAI